MGKIYSLTYRVIIGGIFIFLFSLQAIPVLAAEKVLVFWGDGCPYCEDLKQMIRAEAWDEILEIEFVEVYENTGNREVFAQKLEDCGIASGQAGVPMLFAEGECYMGSDYAYEKLADMVSNLVPVVSSNSATSSSSTASASPVLGEQIAANTGATNTRTFLWLVFAAMVGLLFGGKILTRKNGLAVTVILCGALFLHPAPVAAVCPVCTVAVGAGLGLSRFLGIDDAVTGIWLGGLTLSLGFWAIGALAKRGKGSLLWQLGTIIVTYAFLILPLLWVGMIGSPGNVLFGVDKIILGMTVGSIAFVLGAYISHEIKRSHGGKALFPFQTVILPVSGLWITSWVLYFILYS